jgi:uncharacterized protein YcgI (DUF1989 family)
MATPQFDDPVAMLERSPHLCPTPIDRGFYDRARERLATTPPAQEHELADFGGLALDVPAGAALTLTLREGAQIVNAWACNATDADERIWHESVIREGIYLKPFVRVWGTMARYRPLLTVLEDTVVADPGAPHAQHHPYYGGSGTPADWRAAGGAPDVPSTWSQFAALLEARDMPVHRLNENLCLFQRSYVEPDRQRVEIVPSNAVAGDRITLYAEIDLLVLLALSPYVDGGRPASTPGTPEPRPIAATVSEVIAEPLGWPYPGISYPDMERYLDVSGTRTTEPVPTPGIDYAIAGS